MHGKVEQVCCIKFLVSTKGNGSRVVKEASMLDAYMQSIYIYTFSIQQRLESNWLLSRRVNMMSIERPFMHRQLNKDAN